MKTLLSFLLVLSLIKPALCQSPLNKTIYTLNDISKKNGVYLSNGGGIGYALICQSDSCDAQFYLKFSTSEQDEIVVSQYCILTENKSGNTREEKVMEVKLGIDKISRENCHTNRERGAYYFAIDCPNIGDCYRFNETPDVVYSSGRERDVVSFYHKSAAVMKLFELEFIKLIRSYKTQISQEGIVKKQDIDKAYEGHVKSNDELKVSLRRENGVFIIAINVAGVKSKFILDSGAGDCSISSELEAILLTRKIITPKDYLENGRYQLADGSIVETKRLKIPKITLGTKVIKDVVVSVGSSISPNLLGQSFLSNLNKWSIDNVDNVLIFQ